MIAFLFLAGALATATFSPGAFQENEGIESLIRQLGSDQIVEREEASRGLLSLGKKARPALERAALEQPSIAPRARTVLNQIDRLPECVLETVARKVKSHGADYHRLLRDLEEWSTGTFEGKDWGPFEDALSAAGCKRTEYRRHTEGEGKGQRRTLHAVYVLVQMEEGPARVPRHEVYGDFYVRVHVKDGQRTRYEITDTTLGLRARFGEPLVEAKKRNGYPIDTVMDRFLRHEDPVMRNFELPVLDCIEVRYGDIYDRWSEETARGFHVEMTTQSESGDQYRRQSFTSVSAVDSEGKERLGDFWFRGGHGQGPPFSDWEFVRKGESKPPPNYATQESGCVAFSVPDLESIPADTVELLVDMEHLRNEDLASLKRLSRLRALSFTNGGQLSSVGLNSVGRLKSLAELTLSGPLLEADGLRAIAGLPVLSHLTIYEALRLDRDAFRELGRLASLRSLVIYDCRNLKDIWLEELASLTNLKELEIWASSEEPGDWGLKAFSKIPSLEALELWKPPKATASDMAVLAQMPSLRKLILLYVPLVDETLSELARSRSIETISLSDSKLITAHGLKKILEIPTLKRLNASRCPGLRKEEMEKLGEGLRGTFELKHTPLDSEK